MGRKSRRSGGRAQLGTRQSLGRAMRNKQLGAKTSKLARFGDQLVLVLLESITDEDQRAHRAGAGARRIGHRRG